MEEGEKEKGGKEEGREGESKGGREDFTMTCGALLRG